MCQAVFNAPKHVHTCTSGIHSELTWVATGFCRTTLLASCKYKPLLLPNLLYTGRLKTNDCSSGPWHAFVAFLRSPSLVPSHDYEAFRFLHAQKR